MRVSRFIPNWFLNQINVFQQRLKSTNVKFGSNVVVDKTVFFEGHNIVMNSVKLSKSFVGRGTYISSNSKLVCTKIGRYCSLGSNVQTYLGQHPTQFFVSTHPAFFSLKSASGFSFTEDQLFEEHKFIDGTSWVCEIGNDVWIGNNVLIMDGVKIGNGAVVAAGSIVTKDVEPYSIIGGVPARVFKKRFNEDQIYELEKIKWWNWDHSRIKESATKFVNIELFINEFSV